MLYVKVQKLLYGMLKSALLFYHQLRSDFESDEFMVNTYDPCITNKMVNYNQMMVSWHVDNFKTSHRDPWEITKMAKVGSGNLWKHQSGTRPSS